jgi:hypothetical protein
MKLRSKNMHEGTHNKRYFFTIKVINTAYLVAIEHIDILVDESPPEVGIVLEGPMGSPDIDYTRNYCTNMYCLSMCPKVIVAICMTQTCI